MTDDERISHYQRRAAHWRDEAAGATGVLRARSCLGLAAEFERMANAEAGRLSESSAVEQWVSRFEAVSSELLDLDEGCGEDRMILSKLQRMNLIADTLETVMAEMEGIDLHLSICHLSMTLDTLRVEIDNASI